MPQTTEPLYKNYRVWLLAIISIIIFNIVNRSPVDCASSDSRWTLLVSQSLIENSTMRLDKYADLEGGYTIRSGKQTGYAIEEKNGHYYNFFPMGSSLSSLPFVWVETQLLKKHMKIHSHNKVAQKRISATVAVGIFLLLYLIASLYIKSGWSIAVAFGFWLGTSLSSTLGQGLWSHTFAIFYALISLYLMLKIVREDKDIYWVPLGFTLFMAYLSRPTLSLLSVTVVLYLFFNHKKIVAIKTVVLVFLFIGLLVLYSLSEFDQILPSYYMPKRLSSDGVLTALYANTFSPSRGLFVFSPFLLLFFITPKDTYRVFKENKTLLIVAGWVITHLFIVSKFPHWSGGWCYGPRFMSDVLPAIYILFAILLYQIYSQGSNTKKIVVSIFLLATSIFSIYVHAPKGLYNRCCATTWHRFPSSDESYYFSWKYPQFLHTCARQVDRQTEYEIENIKPIDIAKDIPFDDTNLVFSHWLIEKSVRWSLGKEVKIFFRIKDTDSLAGRLKLKIGTFEIQRIELYINGNRVGSKVVNSFLTPPSNNWYGNVTFKFNPKILKADGVNSIKFILPDARKPDTGNPNEVAIALKTLRIE